MPNTAYEPKESVCLDKGVPSDPKVAEETMYAGDIVYPNASGTYTGNGVSLASQDFGDSNSDEAEVGQVEIPEIHPSSNTPHDKTTAFSAAQAVTVKHHIKGKVYWLHAAASATVTGNRGAKVTIAGSGRACIAIAHTATMLPRHMYSLYRTVSAKAWFLARYDGIYSGYTT